MLSSSSWLGLATHTQRSDSRRGINTVPGVRPGHLLVENSQSTAGIALDWVIRTLRRTAPELGKINTGVSTKPLCGRPAARAACGLRPG